MDADSYFKTCANIHQTTWTTVPEYGFVQVAHSTNEREM